jgi:hypothetical protein
MLQYHHRSTATKAKINDRIASNQKPFCTAKETK